MSLIMPQKSMTRLFAYEKSRTPLVFDLKSEIRITENRKKPEIRRPKQLYLRDEIVAHSHGLGTGNFRVSRLDFFWDSDFELRISGLIAPTILHSSCSFERFYFTLCIHMREHKNSGPL